MRRATALAVPVRTLSSLSLAMLSQFTLWMCSAASQKFQKIRQNLYIWKFKIVQGCSRLSTLIKVKSQCLLW